MPLLNRRDADQPAALECLDEAAFLYVPGGGLREPIVSLRLSLFWRHFLESALPYAGSSGGAMLLGARCPTSPGQERPGLAVFPEVVIASHWNELSDTWRATFLDVAGSDLLVALDVDAALIGDGINWAIRGLAEVQVGGSRRWRRYSDGTNLDLRLLPSE